ncbi:MAG: hypothetical protein AAFR17_00340, partial [Pseudomonadota bacterium]
NRIFSKATAQNRAPEEARAALALVRREAPGSAQHCHALRTLGRVLARRAPGTALGTLAEARQLCAQVHGARDIRLSLIALERALALLRQGSYAAVIETLAGHEARLAELGQEERLAALYTLRARAHQGRGDRGRAAADSALATRWRAYAYGAEAGQAGVGG